MERADPPLCPGKTRLFDEAVLIDDVSLAPGLRLTVGRPLYDLVWTHSIAKEIAIFTKTAKALNLQQLKPCRYSLRHAGASHDFLTRRRAPADIKRRCRWNTDSSVRRYGKESLAMAELHKVPREVRLYGAHAAPVLVQILMGLRPPPALPLLNSGRAAP